MHNVNVEDLTRWHVAWKNWEILRKKMNINITTVIEKLSKGVPSGEILRDVKVEDGDREEIKSLLKKGVKILSIDSPNYPKDLRKLTGKDIYPPLVLYCKGENLTFDRCVAIVGTRNCSFYGRINARGLAKDLVKLDVTVVTGFARGIDTEATCGTLEAGGRTIAVLPWLRSIYPPENETLSLDVMKKGALIGESLEKNEKRYRVAQQLYLRNRITSGISRAVIVVETRRSGGSFYQVDYALKRNKKVFILRPEKDNKEAIEGFNAFLKHGATPITEIREIKNEIQKIL